MATKSQLKYQKQMYQKHEAFVERKKKEAIQRNIKEYNVNKECELLEFLFTIFKDQSKNNVKSILSRNCVAVNGMPTRQFNYKLYKKDTVQISKTPFDRVNTRQDRNESKKTRTPRIEILYEDNDFIAINKPSGLLTMESDKEKIDTAYSYVLKYMQQKDPNARCFQVHRIDKMTSGVLLFVKNYELKEVLRRKWNKCVELREYLAITEGKFQTKKDTIKCYLRETETNLMQVTSNPKEGEEAITQYMVLKDNAKYSLLSVRISTGKKNQIRVVLNHLGHPIVGDDKYGNPKNPINRLGLHASKLVFVHPENGKRIVIEAPAPKEFNKLFG